MFFIEKLSTSLANILCIHLNLDEENKQIISYGAFSFFQTLLAILFVIICSSFFHVLFEALILSFTASALRKYSGGAHASSPNRCALIGAITFTLLAKIVSRLNSIISFKTNCSIVTLCFLLSYFIIYKLTPVDSPAKPIKTQQKKNRLRKSSFLLLNLLVIISIFLLVFYYKFNIAILLIIVQCLAFGVTWQSITLTNFGHLLIRTIDLSLKNIFTKED